MRGVRQLTQRKENTMHDDKSLFLALVVVWTIGVCLLIGLIVV